LSIVPLQYDSATHQVTLYDHLEFEVDHIVSAPPTGPWISQVVINEGQPLCVNRGGQSIRIDITNSIPDNVYAVWVIRDQAGYVIDSERAPLTVVSGTTTIRSTVDTYGWMPGPKDLAVYVQSDSQFPDSQNLSLMARGIGLKEVVPQDRVYPPGAREATWQLAVRDESGALVGGLSPTFGVTIDGRSATAHAEELSRGIYSVAVPLDNLDKGRHLLRIQATDARGITGWYVSALTKRTYEVYLPVVLRGGSRAEP
jgi:hypothetical protein